MLPAMLADIDALDVAGLTLPAALRVLLETGAMNEDGFEDAVKHFGERFEAQNEGAFPPGRVEILAWSLISLQPHVVSMEEYVKIGTVLAARGNRVETASGNGALLALDSSLAPIFEDMYQEVVDRPLPLPPLPPLPVEAGPSE